MTVEIRVNPTPLEVGDAAVVNRSGDPAAVVLGSAATAETSDFATVSHTHSLTDIEQSGATDGQVISWDDSLGEWVPETVSGGATDYVRTRSGTTQDIFDLADTWNDAATTFTAIKMNVTDTASAAASNLLDLQVGGVSRFRVRKDGFARIDGPNNAQVVGINSDSVGIGNFFGTLGLYQSDALRVVVTASSFRLVNPLGFFAWTAQEDLQLHRDAADTLAQRRGTNPQAFRLYNTFTDSSNFERGFMRWNSNTLEIGTEAGGTGGNRNIDFLTGGSARFRITPAGAINLIPAFGQNVTLPTNRTIAYSDGTAEGTRFGIYTGGHGVIIGPSAQFSFAPASAFAGNPDVGIQRSGTNRIKVTNGSTGTGELIFIVPTTDPAIAGALWNDGGTLSISAG